MSLPSRTICRARLPQTSCQSIQHSQTRNATLLARPHRPYTFTQLVTLSDGSTYLTRTTSPAPLYKSTKDTRNHAMWQPSMDSLKNVEQDEAGRLRAFRNRFGRGWDLDAPDEDVSSENGNEVQGKEAGGNDGYDSLMDLISGSAPVYEVEDLATGKGGKGKGGEQKMITIMKDGVLTKVPDTRGSKVPAKKNYDKGWGA